MCTAELPCGGGGVAGGGGRDQAAWLVDDIVKLQGVGKMKHVCTSERLSKKVCPQKVLKSKTL